MRCVVTRFAAFWQTLAMLLAASLLAGGAMAQPIKPVVIALNDKTATIAAEQLGLYWMEAATQVTVEQLAQTASVARFQPMKEGHIYTADPGGALWLHFRVDLDRSQWQGWLLEFPIPVLDLATVYLQDTRGQWQAQSAGDTLPVNTWPEAGRYPTFRLNLAPGQPRDIYVRIRHTTPISLPVRFVSQGGHDQRIQMEYMALGMAFGALLLLIAACAAQAWVYRDRIYAWYSVYAGVMTLAVAAYTGVAGHLLWPAWGYWADASQGILALLAGAAALLFVRHLTGTRARFRWADRAVYMSGWAGVVMAVLFLALSKPVALVMVGAYVGYSAIVNTWMAWLAWRRGDVVGLWVLGAYLPLSIAVLLAVMRIFGVLPTSFGTQYAVVLGIALEVPLLLVALSIRSRERHSTQIREQALSSQDALTGLLAAHLFHDRLRQVVARHRRDRHSAAVVYIDLVNYARIKNFHGASIAEQSLLRSVIKLRRLLRDVDTVSRVGEARFGLILEGVTSRSSVTDRAARLIAAGLMPLKGLKPEVTLQFHIAAVLLDERSMDAPALTDALGDLLKSMSPRTRRPIRFLAPEATQRMPLDEGSLMDADSELPRGGGEAVHPAQSNA